MCGLTFTILIQPFYSLYNTTATATEHGMVCSSDSEYNRSCHTTCGTTVGRLFFEGYKFREFRDFKKIRESYFCENQTIRYKMADGINSRKLNPRN